MNYMKKYLFFFILVIILDTRIICSDFFEQYHIILGNDWSKKIVGVVCIFFMFLYVTIKLYQMLVLSKKLHLFDNIVLMLLTPFLNAYILLSIVFVIRDIGYGMINLILGPLAIILYFVLNFCMWFLLFHKSRVGK